jgi:hypothetical protein
MKVGKAVVVAGIVMLIFGIIFHLQGQSVIGPETSFMYSNPEWVTYGIQITIIGIIAVGTGIIIIKKN